jgi:hypothetical protein
VQQFFEVASNGKNSGERCWYRRRDSGLSVSLFGCLITLA